MFENTADVNGNLPEPEASLSDSNVSEVDAPDGEFQDKSYNCESLNAIPN
jgi:hypothetical protein